MYNLTFIKGQWYEFFLLDGGIEKKYLGECVREQIVSTSNNDGFVGFSCYEKDKKDDKFFDLNILWTDIISPKQIPKPTNPEEEGAN